MRRVVLLIAVITVGACGSPASTAGESASPTASPPATASPTVTPVPASPSASSSARLAAFPDLPFLVGTSSGDLYFALSNGSPAGRKVHVCGSAIIKIIADDRSALIFCEGRQGDATLYLWDASGSVTLVASDALWPGAARTDQGVVYTTLGGYESPAPISMTKLVRKDLRGGAVTTIDERYGVAFDIRPTDQGVAIWRPKNSLSFVRSDAETGTWLLNGTTFTKLSQHRVVGGRGGRWVMETEPVDPATGFFTSSFCCTQVFASVNGAEQRLTPVSVRNEKALAMLDDGRVVAWRSDDEFGPGAVVVYDGAAEQRVDAGPLGSFQPMHSGDWVVVQAPYVTSAAQLRAYRATDGAFAQVELSGVRSIAMLGSR